MNKLTLLSGVAAIALMAGAGDAFACGGNTCTPVNSVVAGNVSASGSAFEKAGIAAVGTGNVQVGVAGGAGSHSTATLQRDANCTSGCITGTAQTTNYAGYNAVGTGDVVISGGLAGTAGETKVNLASQANNGQGETALATANTGAKAGTLVGSADVGHGAGAVSGGAYTGVGSAAEVCAEVYKNGAEAYTRADSAYFNDGLATGDLAGAGSFGLTHTETLAATTATDATSVNTECLFGQCNRGTPIGGLVTTGGVATTVAGAGSLDGDLALHGTATTGSTGYSYGESELASSVSLTETYGKIGETRSREKVGEKKVLWFTVPVYGWVNTPMYGVTGLTGTANTDAKVYAGADATGDLVGAYSFETKNVGSSVNILTTSGF